jgi:hypothetical protein
VNNGGDGGSAHFIFANLNGTISAWDTRTTSKAGRYAGDKHALSAEIDTSEHVICGGRRPEAIGHSNLLHRWTHRSPHRETIVRRPDLT